jgi:hypothetical protein
MMQEKGEQQETARARAVVILRGRLRYPRRNVASELSLGDVVRLPIVTPFRREAFRL